jgi:hypothetical protein
MSTKFGTKYAHFYLCDECEPFVQERAMDSTECRVLGHERWWWVIAIAAFVAALLLSPGHRLGSAAAWAAAPGHEPAVAAVETSGDDEEDGEEIGRC